MWKKKGGSGPAWEEMGGDRRERVRGVTPVIVHFKGGKGTVSGTQQQKMRTRWENDTIKLGTD